MQPVMAEKLLSSLPISDSSFTATAGNAGTFANFGGIPEYTLRDIDPAKHFGMADANFRKTLAYGAGRIKIPAPAVVALRVEKALGSP